MDNNAEVRDEVNEDHSFRSSEGAPEAKLPEGALAGTKDEQPQPSTDFPEVIEEQSTKIPEATPEEKEEAMVYINFKRKFKEEKNIYNTWYIINKRWIDQWKSKIKYDFIKPHEEYHYSFNRKERIDSPFTGDLPPISNAEMIIDASTYVKLKEDTQMLIHPNYSHNLKIVNGEVWKYLLSKYQGGPELKFELKEGASEEQIPEFNYLTINFFLFPLRSELNAATEEDSIKLKEYTMYMHLNPTLGGIKERIIKLIKENSLLGEKSNEEFLDEKSIRLWALKNNVSLSYLQMKLNRNKEEIAQADKTLDSNDFDISYVELLLQEKFDKIYHRADSFTFCLERSTSSSPFIFGLSEMKIGKCEYDNVRGVMTAYCKCKLVWYCNEMCLKRDKQYHEPNCPKRLEDENLILSTESAQGLCGLSNLGNTCFMNTSLQCLSNCFHLTDYFIRDLYQKDLNADNPLGSSGLIAKVYAHFLKNLWYGSSSVFTPNYFKQSLGNYLKIFSGVQQHDTQEFLNYLLDVLHEDLNKVLKKPIVQLDETNQPDHIKSQSHWVSFLKRNQSVLVDTFYGQFKSTLTCPMEECKNISITFDPFLSISLPLTSKVQAYTVGFFFIFHNVSLSPLYFQIPFYKNTTFMALRNKIAQMLNIHPWSFFITMLKKKQSIQELIPETKPLHILSTSEKTNYFIFQINPALFYSAMNVSIEDLQESAQYEREFRGDANEYANSRKEAIAEVYSANYEENAVNTMGELSANYGLCSDIVTTILQFMDKISDYTVFPRVVCLNKTWSIKEVYWYVYSTYKKVMCDSKHKTPRHPLSNSPQREGEDNTNCPSSSTEFEDLFKEIKDEDSFNEAFSSNLIPFAIRYLPRNRTTPKETLYYFSTDTLETYYTKYTNEPDHLCFSVNKQFTLGIVWNTKYSHNTEKLQKYEEPKIYIEHTDNKTIDFYECFDRFVKEEVLEENNEWYCPKCKEHRRATKKIELYKIPKYLIIHLKRFNNKTKLDNVVNFPIKDLDIAKYVISDDKDTQFDLVAIANHYGSMNFGHYIAFAKNHIKDQWYEFDDSRVSTKDEDDLVSSSAYVLFYSKKSNSSVDWNEIYNRSFVNFETESNDS